MGLRRKLQTKGDITMEHETLPEVRGVRKTRTQGEEICPACNFVANPTHYHTLANAIVDSHGQYQLPGIAHE